MLALIRPRRENLGWLAYIPATWLFLFAALALAARAQTPQAAKPVISVPGGSYNFPQTVKIKSATPGVKIYYSVTVGGIPLGGGLYTGPITVSQNEVIEAVAEAAGYANSKQALVAYTINIPSEILSVSGSDPYTMACHMTGLTTVGAPPATGTVSFRDATTGKILGTAPLTDSTVTTSAGNTIGVGVANTAPGLVTADFNGDGIPDLAVSDYDDAAITVWLGAGDGAFTGGSNYTVGRNPEGLAVGDFNGDGVPDLAVTDSYFGTVSILLGNGDGTFQSQQSIFCEQRPTEDCDDRCAEDHDRCDIEVSAGDVSDQSERGYAESRELHDHLHRWDDDCGVDLAENAAPRVPAAPRQLRRVILVASSTETFFQWTPSIARGSGPGAMKISLLIY